MRRAELIFAILLSAAGVVPAQQASLVSSGNVELNGQTRAYVIRHLPLTAFPELPEAVTQALTERGCTIPQSYEAHRPENVVHGSFERAGSGDWAVLCSAEGTVSLLVFFASAPGKPVTLASAAETARLQAHPGSVDLGFNWAIDPAMPERVYEAQHGMFPRPARLEHDALADSTVEGKVIYRYFANGDWTVVPLPS